MLTTPRQYNVRFKSTDHRLNSKNISNYTNCAFKQYAYELETYLFGLQLNGTVNSNAHCPLYNAGNTNTQVSITS